ncbi:hypothetical protein CP8484711_1135 [Chlamydia psittaci 84-8471/1]|nr:hypothetical protein CP8484711_1135 [Chlamydia psittaci 84-8471/1]
MVILDFFNKHVLCSVCLQQNCKEYGGEQYYPFCPPMLH